MLARVHSAALSGIDARVLDVEVDVGSGLPRSRSSACPTPPSARRASASARRCATAASRCPADAVTVNLAPADLAQGRAPPLDLPVAVGLLAIGGLARATRGAASSSESSGSRRRCAPVRGALSLALAARDAGFEEVVLPAANAAEAAAVDGSSVVAGRARSAAAVAHLTGDVPIAPRRPAPSRPAQARVGRLRRHPGPGRGAPRPRDRRRRRAPRCSSSGRPAPARRCSPAACRRPSAADARRGDRGHEDPLGRRAAPRRRGLMRAPPFRAPHHGISAAGLVGGGARPAPGEISLAHRGVLFLDELPGVPARRARSDPPAARGTAHRARARGRRLRLPLRLPPRRRDEPLPVRASPETRGVPARARRDRAPRYTRKISGPLLDRIDLHVPVPPVPWSDLSRALRGRVLGRDPRARGSCPRRAAARAPGERRLPQCRPDRRRVRGRGAARCAPAAACSRPPSTGSTSRSEACTGRCASRARSPTWTGASACLGRHLAEAISYRLRTAP